MTAIFTLLLVLAISLIITRVATIMLSHTGLSRESARFQARSAFTGVGFTTNESESLVNHPVRRRILMALMLLGNAGIISVVSSVILTLLALREDEASVTVKVLSLALGVALLWIVATSKLVDRHLSRVIERALNKFTSLEVRDYENLLQLSGDFRVCELALEPGDWLANKTLQSAALRGEGVNVLGVKRANGDYVGSPNGETLLLPGDNLIVYGRVKNLEGLDQRRKGWQGDVQHHQAVADDHAPGKPPETKAPENP